MVDNLGDLLISGWFSGTADMDIGVVTAYHTSKGNRDVFILKMDSLGSYLWSKSFGSTSFDVSYGISNDQNGNVFQTGLFAGSVDFNPTSGILNLTSNGGRDCFISKYTSSGTFYGLRKLEELEMTLVILLIRMMQAIYMFMGSILGLLILIRTREFFLETPQAPMTLFY